MTSPVGAIREYRPAEDSADLRACMVELQEYERGIEPSLPPGPAIADAYLAFLFERCADCDGKVFVAEADGRVVGFVSVWTKVRPSSPDEGDDPYAYVSDLAVVPGHRRRGLGAALLERAETHAREKGARQVRIGVLAGNAIARRMYLDAGYSERRVELAKPIDAIPAGDR